MTPVKYKEISWGRHGKEKSMAHGIPQCTGRKYTGQARNTRKMSIEARYIAKGEISCFNFRVISGVSWAKVSFLSTNWHE
jgi:hypothetical protein